MRLEINSGELWEKETSYNSTEYMYINMNKKGNSKIKSKFLG